jgi:hypothetical protein
MEAICGLSFCVWIIVSASNAASYTTAQCCMMPRRSLQAEQTSFFVVALFRCGEIHYAGVYFKSNNAETVRKTRLNLYLSC